MTAMKKSPAAAGRRGVARVVLAVTVVGAACGTTPQPNFAGLQADSRTLKVHNEIRLLELTNGMKVALAPDNRTNLVSVDVRYRFGANQDPPGQVGLAHLAEHLTFQLPGDGQGKPLFDKFTALALTFNAYTSHDVTHYTSTALANRVDALLELEARRLETPCAAVPDPAFVRERDIVLEEDAERATPLTPVATAIDKAVWGPGHPYARGIGSRDMATITKADACKFIDAYYGPKRAVLVVSGNFNPEAMQPRIGRRFGPIARTSTVPAVLDPIDPPALTGTQSRITGDVEHPTAVVVLPAPPWGAADEAMHDATLGLLRVGLDELDAKADWVLDAGVGYGGDGYQRVTEVFVEVDDPARLEAAAQAVFKVGREILADDDHDGNADDDDDPDDRAVAHLLAAVKGRMQTATITSVDRFWDKGQDTANYLTYTDHYDFAFARMRATDGLKGGAIVGYAQRLFDPAHARVLQVLPSGKPGGRAATTVAASAHEYDLPAWRTAVDPADAARPEPVPPEPPRLHIDDFRLVNGLRVLVYAEPLSQAFEARLVFPRGRIDEAADQRGVASLAARMLDHDFAREYPAHTVDLINWALRLGTLMGAYADEDVTVFSARGLAMFGDWHLWRLAWLIDQGVYSSADLAALRKDLDEADERETSPSAAAFRARLYGADHPYTAAAPTLAELAAIPVGALRGWRAHQLSLDGATLIVSGGFDQDAMHQHVVDLFGGIGKTTPPPRAVAPAPRPAAGPSLIGTRLPEATQVALYVSFTAASDRDRDRAARAVLSAMIADRLRVVREGMGATYGVSSSYEVRAAASTLDVMASLDPQRAPRAAAAVLASLAALRDDPQAAAADFVRARRREVSDALARSIDAESVAGNLEWAVRHGGDLASLRQWPAALAQVTLDDVAAVARADLDPARMVVSVDGPRAPIEATLTALGAKDVAWFDE